MSDPNQETPVPKAAIDDIEIEGLSDELLEEVAGGDSMCSAAYCSLDNQDSL
jgi:hypothetical protein